MFHYFSRFTGAALVATALLSGTASAQTTNAKLDESLRESVERGCYGKQSVIITVDPGYREALRLALSAHGDAVTGEFPAINAIAAEIHCADLATLASFGSIRAVSANASVGVSAAKDNKVLKNVLDKAAQALARQVEALAAKLLKKNAFASLGATKIRDIKPSGVMLVPSTAWSDEQHVGHHSNELQELDVFRYAALASP